MLNTRNSGRFLWVGWHLFRERARKEEWSPEVFSEIEQTRYDLDTARITGEDNEELGIEDRYSDRLDTVNVIESNPERYG